MANVRLLIPFSALTAILNRAFLAWTCSKNELTQWLKTSQARSQNGVVTLSDIFLLLSRVQMGINQMFWLTFCPFGRKCKKISHISKSLPLSVLPMRAKYCWEFVRHVWCKRGSGREVGTERAPCAKWLGWAATWPRSRTRPLPARTVPGRSGLT